MIRPKLLDLFCCQGGAGMGYHRAGFEVVGVDKEPQPRYPFTFVQADALDVLEHWDLSAFAAIHASPPCQDHIRGGLQNAHDTGWLLAATRDMLKRSGLPWVIENVPGAPMRADYLLCGSHFGLPIRRHRWFETSWHGFSLIACDHSKPVHGVYGHPRGARGGWPGMLPDGPEEWSAAMGIDWMTTAGLFPRTVMPPRPQRLPAPELSREWRERATGPAPATIGPIAASMVPSSLREALVAAARPLAGRQHPFTPDMLFPHMCLCGMAEADPWHERPQAPAAAEEPPPELSPPPGGVLGYVVVLAGEARSTLTDSDLKTRGEAEAEAAAWAKREAWRGRVTVCEVRAAGDVS